MSSSVSKLDYLSKIYGDAEDSDRGKKKRKKSKKRKRKHNAETIVVKEENETKNSSGNRAAPPDGNHRRLDTDEDLREEEDEGNEDGPVIVNSEELLTDQQTSALSPKQEFLPTKEEDDTNNRASSLMGASRKRYDSSSEDEKEDNNDNKKGNDRTKPAQLRFDSSDDEGNKTDKARRTKRHDSSEEDGDDDESRNVARTSAGHKAGLRTGREFAKDEERIQRDRRTESRAMVDKHGMGETVHRKSRDSRDIKDNTRRVLDKAEQTQLNTGSVQQRQKELAAAQFSRIQQSSFARDKDDTEINELQRNAIREGDPMARHHALDKKPNKQTPTNTKREFPVYKGPSWKPNRFGIRPGFRWDGNDRGNGFEDRLLAKQANRAQQNEEAYKWSASAM